MLRDKTIFALLAAALLGVGLMLVRFTPMVMKPRQGVWLALECLAILLLFFLKEYRSDTPALRALAASRGTAWAFMLAALALDFAVLVYGESHLGARHYLFLGGFGLRVSPVSFLLVMAFVSLRLGQRPAGRCEFLAILAALAAHFLFLSFQPDLVMFFIQLACLLIVGLLGESKKDLIVLLTATQVVFGLPFVLMGLGTLERTSVWLFDPASDPYKASYQLGKMLRAFQASGLWGAENAAALQNRLTLPEEPTVNALPHLSLLWGNVATAVCVALLLALMWILLLRIARLENPVVRNGTFGVWVFLAFTQLGGVGAPLCLAPLPLNWGLAFVGSQSLGGLLLLLAMVCWAAPATGSGGIGAFLRRGFLWRKETQPGVDTRLLADAWRFAAQRSRGQNDPGAERGLETMGTTTEIRRQ
ncbi:MAG: FtsW/RodA/SpoVE family cell cycle protein [Burkholderiaceae bacterium]|jgi:cell division protein FtsW (lipid II flippase)|nr:FtsW/RodA/SpoVE family cell cycle protein [Burkholderiaceae bacterium]